MHLERLVGEFFARLEKIDERTAAVVAAGRCGHCGGPLHQSHHHRKPRGGLLAAAGEAYTRRHSLCCGRRVHASADRDRRDRTIMISEIGEVIT